MKELQNFVYRHMDALKHHKRYLAMLTALSMLVTFIVPLILVEPADSMTGILVCNKTVHTHNAECYVGDTLICDIEEHIHTGACYKKISTVSLKGDASGSEYTDYNIPVYNAGSGVYNESIGRYDELNGNKVDGVTYSPAELPLYTLLFGELNEQAKEDGKEHWVDPKKSVEDNLEIVDDEYFLGFASDFCAFIENDFVAYDADAEGRMFVGGDLIFNGNSEVGEWNYQVGAGDYGQFTPIWQTDEYGHLKGFASAIIGGKVYRLATMTTGAYASLESAPELPSGKPARHTDGNDVMLYPEEGAYKRFVIGNLKDSLHYDEDGAVADIFYGLSCNHLFYNHDNNCTVCIGKDNAAMDAGEHGYLGEVNELSQFYQYENVRTILERTFDMLRARSLSLGSVEAKAVSIENNKLTLDASNIGDAKTVYFKLDKWSSFSDVEIKVPSDRVKKIGPSEYTQGEETITELDLNIIITCDDENIAIDISDPYRGLITNITYKDNSGDRSFQISKMGDNNGTNNHPLSSNILYNFPYAKKIEFKDTQTSGGANFNGTIMAPNAHVKTENKCPGHLSGALIAKSFEGGLEFGYRPYRGGVDIFGMASGYAIPVNKFGDDGKTALPGALFAIKQDGKFVSLFESGNGTNFAALPSKVDFSGKTAYEQDEISGGSGNRDYAGNTVIGEKLTAPVDFTLYYKDSNGNNQIITDDTNLENLTVFYLEPNQKVNLDSNENFVYTYDENNNIYTIYPIKLIESFDVTAKNAADNTSSETVTVNFSKKESMGLTVDKTSVTIVGNISEEIPLRVTNPPTGNTIYYKYFANGNEIRANDSTQDDGYTTQSSGSYTPTVAGGLELKVKAYVKVGNDYYEVESATGNKVTVKDFQFDEDMAIRIPESINSGEKLTINVDNAPSGATIYYTFYNSSEQSGNEFDTNGVVGENLKVKARVVVGNQSMTLEDTITVNFPENHGITLNASQTEYEVNSYDKLYFSIQNADHYQNKTVIYYFNDKPIENNGNSVAKTIVGDSYAYAVISVNGLELKTESVKVTGKYHDQLGLNLSQGPYTAGNNINLSVNYAPNGAKVVFEVLNSNNESVFTSDEKTVSNGEATATFTPQTAGNYTFKAYMTFESNTKRNFETKDIKVAARPVYGELSVDPQQVNTGDKVNLKVYNATSGATVSFEIFQKSDLNNSIKTINGHEGNSGEYTAEYTPTLSGEFVVKAIISKDGVTNSNNTKELTVNENTSTLSGKWEVKSTGTEPGSNVQIYVSEAPNNAIIKIYVTKPGGTEELVRNENMNNSTYNWNYQLSDRGTYKFRGELVRNGEIYNLGEKEITIANIIGLKVISGYNSNQNFEIDKPVTLGLETVPENTARIDYYLVSLDASKPMHEIGENRIVCSYNDDMTITFTPGQTGDHQYCAKAYNVDGELIGTMTSNVTFKTVAPEYSVTIKTKVGDTYTTDFYGGDTVTLEISDIPSGRTITNVNATIENNNVNEWNVVEAGKTYTFVTSDYEGYISDEEKTLTVKVYFDNGYSATASIQIINRKRPETTTASTNSDATTTTTVSAASYSVRRYLSILADENTNSSPDDDLIVINGNGETFKSVKLTFPGDVDAKNASFTIKATFKDVGGAVIDEKTYSNSDVADGNYIDITNINSNVATIEITPVTGSITIANCYPTFTKTENIITQKYAQDFTLKQSEQKEIVLTDWAKGDSTQILDSIIINLDEITNANEGDVYCALIPKVNEGETAVVDFKKATISNNKIEIKDINAAIEKIKIYTTKPSLTINDYTISAFVGSSKYSEDELKDFRTQTQDIINVYTLVEQQAPVGYFKEEKVYIVEVKETIKFYETAGESPYPRDVLTTVTVKKTDGTEVLSYAVDVDYSSSNGTKKKIITIVDNDENPDNNVKFTLTKGEDGNLTVDCTDAYVGVSEWSTTTKPVSNDGYYFDPNAMMVVPVSNEPIKYTNKMGLLFRKVEKSGAIVKGVEISLVPDESKNGKSLWYWDENTSEWLIDYTNLVDEKVYKFTETYGGSKYELADDIYFKKTGDKQITYWIGSESQPPKKTNENQLTVLNLSESFESRVIRMENIRVVGIKPTLKKTDMDGNIIDGSAKFALYAADGTELLNPIDVVNGKVDFYFDPQKIYDAKYVEDGYLKPGSYYLQELNAPDRYEAATRSFGFEIVKNDDDVYSIIPSNPGMGETIGDIAWSTPTKPDYTIDELTFYYADGTFKKNSKEVEVTGNTYWYTLDYVGAGLDPKNVVGIKLKVGGNGTEDKKFMIRHSGNKKGDEIWGETKDSTNGDYTNVKPRDEYYTFGDVPEDDSQIVVDPKPTIDVGSKNTILISNKPLSDTMNLRVDKKWVGDAGITELRKPVEVQLMQKLGDGDYENYDPPIESAETTDNGTEAVPADSTEETPTSGKVILNAANNWSYVWENLPRYVNGKDDTGGLCYYKINEVTAIDGYTTSIIGTDINNGGTIIIKNTAETMDIPVEKTWTWEAGKYNPTIPRTVKLKLQINVGEESSPNWKDVPGKTLVLTGNGDTWQGKFTGLIKGYQYQVVEAEVPFGWNPVYTGAKVTAPTGNVESFDGKFTVTNNYSIPEGSLAVQKLWDEMGGTLPHSITVDLYRSVIAPSYAETDAPWTDGNSEKADADKNDYKTDYARLLQHSLYFYDANMCGTDVAAKSALAWRTNCHTEDEILGGYHDAGDHVMFGLPQGYAASMLGWTYYEFIKGNISDTEEGKIPSEEANHFKVILERFYDFFANSVRYDENGDISEILVQKGGGNIDHSYWGSPEKQVTREKEMFWSNYGADIASEYAAALALGYLNFKDSDSEKYEKYLKVAKDLFEFAEKNPSAYNEWGVNKDETQKGVDYPGFYSSQTHNDDMALAAGWLHLADPNGGYKDKFDAIGKNDDKWFSWNDVSLAAYAVGAYIGSNSWSTFADKINAKIDEDNPEKYFFQDGWGSARYNAIMQTAALVAAKHDQNKEKYKSWAQGQMNMLLGDNSWNDKINGVCDGGTVSNTNSPICLVTNFVPDGFTTDTPQAPHHRAASGWDSLEEYKVNCGYDDDSYALIGAMVGGPVSDNGNSPHTGQAQMDTYKHNHPKSGHSYIDDLHDYCCNEVSIDYNAGLVGAAAGLYYFYGSGAFSNKIEGVEYGAYGLAPYVEGDIEFNNAQNNPLVDEDINAAVLKSFAMKQTKVRVLADEPYTLNANELEALVSSGWSVPDTYAGRSILSIEVTPSGVPSWGVNVRVCINAPYQNAIYGSNVYSSDEIIIPSVGGFYSSVDNSNVKYANDSISLIHIQENNFKVESVTINFAGGGTPISGITLSDTEVNIGETVDITVVGEKTSEFTQSPTDSGEVEFNQTDNKATAKKAGKVTIKATVDGEEKTAELTIKPMNLIAPEGNIVKGNSVKFSVSEPPVGATKVEYMNGAEKIGESSNQPNYELNYAFPESGEHTITAIAYYGDNETTSAECTVNVLAEAPTPIEITNVPNPAELIEGDKYTFTSNKDNAQWTITENSSAASIDNSGNLTVKNVNSETQIKVKAYTSDSDFDEITIKILPINITYNGQSSLSLKLGDTTEYDLNVDRGTDLTWGSTNTAVVSVVDDKNGKIKVGNTAGPAQIIVAKNGETLATFNVTVDSESSGSGSTTGGSITFQNTVSQLYNGGNFTFTVNKTGDVKDVKWSVSDVNNENNDKIRIDEDTGELTIAHDANSDNIKVIATPYDSNDNALTAITKEVNIPNMQINNLGDQIKMGQTVHSVYLQNKPNSGSVTWSAEPSDMLNIVSPNDNQTNIIGLNKEGEAVVIATVTDNGNVIAVAKKTVKVEKPTFSFKNEIGSMMVGGNAKLEINNTDNVSNITTEWSSSKPNVASVDEHGNVNAKGEGEAVITATIYTKINNIDYKVGELTQTINVTEYLPDPPGEDYKLITSYAYPEGSNTVQKDKDLKLKLDSILAGHPVDAVIVEFEKASFNGVVYWSDSSLAKADGKNPDGTPAQDPKFKYDSCDSFTIKFNEVGYTDGQTVPGEFAIRYWWAQNGSITVKKVYFYAKTLIPKIINAPSEMAVGDKYTLKAIALSGAASWTSSDPDIATIDPDTGEITAKNTGNVTFTANDEVSVTIPIKRKLEFIDENENPVEISKIRNNVTANLSIYGEGVEYEITEGGDIITIDSTTGTLTPIPGKTGPVKFKAIYAGENESNTVTLTVVDALKIIGENQQMPVGTKQQLTVENDIGDVEWSIKSGKTDIIEITENGLVIAKSYGQETVVVRDSDGATVEFIIDAIVKPLLPKDTENVKRVEFTAKNAIIKDVVDGKLEPVEGFETTNHEDWTVKLENLPLCDEKGNPYYYYIEETMYKKTSSSLDETLDPKNANGYYVLSSDTKYVPIGYNAQGSVPTEKNYPTLRVGNMATEKVEGQLPSTGGSGVTTYYYLGGVIMLLSIAGFTGLKRRERKRRKE